MYKFDKKNKDILINKYVEVIKKYEFRYITLQDFLDSLETEKTSNNYFVLEDSGRKFYLNIQNLRKIEFNLL